MKRGVCEFQILPMLYDLESPSLPLLSLCLKHLDFVTLFRCLRVSKKLHDIVKQLFTQKQWIELKSDITCGYRCGFCGSRRYLDELEYEDELYFVMENITPWDAFVSILNQTGPVGLSCLPRWVCFDCQFQWIPQSYCIENELSSYYMVITSENIKFCLKFEQKSTQIPYDSEMKLLNFMVSRLDLGHHILERTNTSVFGGYMQGDESVIWKHFTKLNAADTRILILNHRIFIYLE